MDRHTFSGMSVPIAATPTDAVACAFAVRSALSDAVTAPHSIDSFRRLMDLVSASGVRLTVLLALMAFEAIAAWRERRIRISHHNLTCRAAKRGTE
jgi:hypothetical protein